jgi:hypothetical protein
MGNYEARHDSPRSCRDALSKGYTRLDKIRREVMGKELEISGIQDMRSKHKQNWINHLERMDNTRLLKHALNYKPKKEEIVDALGNDGNASMPEQVKRPNPWRKTMMMMMMMTFLLKGNSLEILFTSVLEGKTVYRVFQDFRA